MKEMKIVQCLIICCMMMSGAALLIETPSAALDTDDADNRETHGSDFTTDGNLVVIILQDNPQNTSPISWNNTTQVYDLQFPSAERLRVKAVITGLELERNFDLDWQVYAYIGNRTTYGPIHHFSGSSDAFSGLIQFNTHTGSTTYISPLFDNPDSGISINQHPANQAGCYWVMATISDKSAHISEVMTSNISKMVSYGPDNQCPTDIQDGDGDGYDDVSYTAGQNSVDITTDNPSCNWDAYVWNGTHCIQIVDPTADNPDCNWTTQAWNGTVCIDLVDTSSDIPNCNWDTHTWNGQECIEKCRENDTSSDETIDPGKEDDDDIDITGSGDAADLTVIGGAALLAGIGIATLLGQTGRGPNMGGDNKKPNIDMDDIVDVIDDLDIDLDADLDLDKPDTAKEKSRSRGGSDQYFKSGVERQKAMTDSGDPLLDDYIEDEPED